MEPQNMALFASVPVSGRRSVRSTGMRGFAHEGPAVSGRDVDRAIVAVPFRNSTDFAWSPVAFALAARGSSELHFMSRFRLRCAPFQMPRMSHRDKAPDTGADRPPLTCLQKFNRADRLRPLPYGA